MLLKLGQKRSGLMLRLSKRVEYGLMAVLHMDQADEGTWTTAAELAATYQIPAELLGKVLQALGRAGILKSAHGAKGGYQLARPMDELVLCDVLEAIEGPFRLVRCQEEPHSCDQYEVCSIREPVLDIQQQLLEYLGGFELKAFRLKKRKINKRQENLCTTN